MKSFKRKLRRIIYTDHCYHFRPILLKMDSNLTVSTSAPPWRRVILALQFSKAYYEVLTDGRNIKQIDFHKFHFSISLFVVMTSIIQKVEKKHASDDVKHHALYAYFYLGYNKSRIAKIYKKHPTTINNWIQRYEESGSVKSVNGF